MLNREDDPVEQRASVTNTESMLISEQMSQSNNLPQ